jgi:hypothetical protein
MQKLLFILLLSASFSCSKKETIIEYKVSSTSRPNTFACKYTLSSPGRVPIDLWDECGKYKHGEVVLRVVE